MWPKSHLTVPYKDDEQQVVHRSRRLRVYLQPGSILVFKAGLVHRGVGREAQPETLPYHPFPLAAPDFVVVDNNNKAQCASCAKCTCGELCLCSLSTTYCLDCFENIGTTRLHAYGEDEKRKEARKMTLAEEAQEQQERGAYRKSNAKGDMNIKLCKDCELCKATENPNGLPIIAKEGMSNLDDDGWQVFESHEFGLLSADVMKQFAKDTGRGAARFWNPIFNNYEVELAGPATYELNGVALPLNVVPGKRWMNAEAAAATMPSLSKQANQAIAHTIDVARSLVQGISKEIELYEIVFLHTSWLTPDQDPHRDWPRKLLQTVR